MPTPPKKSAARVARGSGSLSPQTAKLVATVSKRAGRRATMIMEKHAAR
jgi:hypothetical protein